MTDRRHGYARYRLDGCRCYTCAYAVSEYNAHRQRSLTAGTWAPWVDAEPARLHLCALADAGLGSRRVADLTGLRRNTVQNLRHTDRARVRAATAAAILALEPTLDNIAPHAPVSGLGTTRRLRALVRAGWPQSHLAEHVGQTGPIVKNTPRSVTARTARDTRTLYRLIAELDPRAHGIPEHIAQRTRTRATAHGWPGPMCWDDDTIDNPDVEPEWTGRCGTTAGWDIHRREGIPPCPPCRNAHTTRRPRQDTA
ncbi:hypothetical protein [Embleya sp. NPDC005971]|uniref:hypothetical protein n=1 Tax=Embleya sp. NPDC005971 TaxID=3156724 RepID=UPI00340313F5